LGFAVNETGEFPNNTVAPPKGKKTKGSKYRGNRESGCTNLQKKKAQEAQREHSKSAGLQRGLPGIDGCGKKKRGGGANRKNSNLQKTVKGKETDGGLINQKKQEIRGWEKKATFDQRRLAS